MWVFFCWNSISILQHPQPPPSLPPQPNPTHPPNTTTTHPPIHHTHTHTHLAYVIITAVALQLAHTRTPLTWQELWAKPLIGRRPAIEHGRWMVHVTDCDSLNPFIIPNKALASAAVLTVLCTNRYFKPSHRHPRLLLWLHFIWQGGG